MKNDQNRISDFWTNYDDLDMESLKWDTCPITEAELEALIKSTAAVLGLTKYQNNNTKEENVKSEKH